MPQLDVPKAFLILVLCAGLMLAACDQIIGTPAQNVTGGDATRGRAALRDYGCGACHSIPGVRGATAEVGPPLDHFANRRFIGGELPNEPDNLVKWIMNPQAVEPGTAMPNLNVSEATARDMAEYLYTLR